MKPRHVCYLPFHKRLMCSAPVFTELIPTALLTPFPRFAVIEAQNTLSKSVLEKCPGRSELEKLITKLMDYPKNGMPFKRGGTQFQRFAHSLVKVANDWKLCVVWDGDVAPVPVVPAACLEPVCL